MKVGLNKEKSQEICQKLNLLLANLSVFYVKLHNYHWNVVGVGFFEIHTKLEELYNEAATEIDNVAERILTLEERPLATMKEYLEVASLKEVPSLPKKPSEIAKDVRNDFQTLLSDIREIIKAAEENQDDQTINLLNESIGNYEKHIWMFSAYLEEE